LQTFDAEIPSFRSGPSASRVHEWTNGTMPTGSIYICDGGGKIYTP